MQLKQLTPIDWKAYRDIRLSALQSPDALAFGGSYEKESVRTEEEWRHRLDASDSRFHYGILEGNELVATGGAYFNEEEKRWIVVGVYTRPEFRRKGLSAQLLQAVCAELISRGVPKVTLMVNTKQESAVNLYKKLGFEIVETMQDQPMGDGELHDEFVMEKVL